MKLPAFDECDLRNSSSEVWSKSCINFNIFVQ